MWVEVYAPSNNLLILWSTPVFLNSCGYIQAIGSDVPCTEVSAEIFPYELGAEERQSTE